MESYVTVKASNDYYDDVHYEARSTRGSTLCGLKVTSKVTEREATCLRCRQFAAGDF
ncbi:MAG TPA: hypothetical protein VMV53_10770 [Acidimicrobiales bacterium]|nr:hypothetical protein [Acidimicrobiales bacterium]